MSLSSSSIFIFNDISECIIALLIVGDEVLEIAGISLRGKSGLFVEDLMNKLQDEFEILIRHQNNTNDVINTDISSLPTDTKQEQRLSMGPTFPSISQVKSTSISSFHPNTSTTSVKNFLLPYPQ